MSTKLHRERLFSLFEENQEGVIYLRGGEIMHRYETDYEFPFRQESNFWYLTGVDEPDYHLVMDLKSKTYHLFTPKRDSRFAVWHGRIKPMEQIKKEYEPDELHYDNELLTVLNNLKPSTIYCLNEEQAEFLEDLNRGFNVETESLVDAITYCRCIKTEHEMEKLREAARVNNLAHKEAMINIKPDMYEYEMKALFDYMQISNGLLYDAYSGIHASGENSAILHYTENNDLIEDGDLFLLDAGYEYKGYASDVTRTFPANGKFSGDQAAMYQIVLDSQNAVIDLIKPGVKMEDLHMAAARIITMGLKDAGLIKGDIEELMDQNIFALFFPHGLGHFLGLDTHDVGGYPKGVDRIDRPGIQFLRVRRELLPGMVITIEPGLYFIPALLKPALEDSEKSKYLNGDKLEKMFGFGGIRIEDNLIITEDGCENLTDVPKEIKEIEDLMKES